MQKIYLVLTYVLKIQSQFYDLAQALINPVKRYKQQLFDKPIPDRFLNFWETQMHF